MNDERNDIFPNEEPENESVFHTEEIEESSIEINPVMQTESFAEIEYDNAEKSKKKRKNPHPVFVTIASVLMFALLAGTFAAMNYINFPEKTAQEQSIYHSSNLGPANAVNISDGQFVPTGAELSTAEIAAKVGPCVVGIENKSRVPSMFQRQAESTSTGSGVIVNENGYIVTNFHVIEGADELNVILNSGMEYPAEVIGYDERSDLAVIKIEETGLVYATFGDSSQLMVGERAIAIGNPLGTELMGTVTQGIISAVNRTVQVEDKTLTLLQTDAAINSGNSGGALINSRGEVIGINTVKMYATGVEGIGFAIPSNEVKRVMDDIVNYGYVRGRLVVGVTGTNITEKMAGYYELPVGFYVSEVREGYGAYLAGVQVGDVIIKCDGKVVKTIDDINEARDSHEVGDYMEIVVSRDGENVTLKVKLMEERPE